MPSPSAPQVSPQAVPSIHECQWVCFGFKNAKGIEKKSIAEARKNNESVGPFAAADAKKFK